jgi:hypothetical protein
MLAQGPMYFYLIVILCLLSSTSKAQSLSWLSKQEVLDLFPPVLEVDDSGENSNYYSLNGRALGVRLRQNTEFNILLANRVHFDRSQTRATILIDRVLIQGPEMLDIYIVDLIHLLKYLPENMGIINHDVKVVMNVSLADYPIGRELRKKLGWFEYPNPKDNAYFIVSSHYLSPKEAADASLEMDKANHVIREKRFDIQLINTPSAKVPLILPGYIAYEVNRGQWSSDIVFNIAAQAVLDDEIDRRAVLVDFERIRDSGFEHPVDIIVEKLLNLRQSMRGASLDIILPLNQLRSDERVLARALQRHFSSIHVLLPHAAIEYARTDLPQFKIHKPLEFTRILTQCLSFFSF